MPIALQAFLQSCILLQVQKEDHWTHQPACPEPTNRNFGNLVWETLVNLARLLVMLVNAVRMVTLCIRTTPEDSTCRSSGSNEAAAAFGRLTGGAV
jgi:hypothetical protein